VQAEPDPAAPARGPDFQAARRIRPSDGCHGRLRGALGESWVALWEEVGYCERRFRSGRRAPPTRPPSDLEPKLHSLHALA